MPLVLLQLRTDVPYQRIFILLLVILAVITVGFIVVQRVKRAYQADDLKSDAAAGFSLSDLRELHKAGRMTDEEFEKAKARVIDAAKRAAEREAAAKAAKEKEENRGF